MENFIFCAVLHHFTPLLAAALKIRAPMTFLVLLFWLRCYYTLVFYEQPVVKQLNIGWQIAKKLSGPKPLSLNNNKNYRSKNSGFFLL